MILLIYLNIIFLVQFTEQARILCIYLVPFYSSQSVFRVLTDELASQGHELVVFTSLPRREPIENVTEIDVQRVSFASWDEGYSQAAMNRNTFAIQDSAMFWNMSATIMVSIYDNFFGHPHLQSLIKNKSHFDLILMDACSSFGSILRTRFRVPIILVSSMTASASTFSLVGAETNIFMYPDFNIMKAWNLSISQKIRTIYQYWKLKITASGANKVNSVVKKYFGEQSPSFSELNKGVEMLFVNVHRLWDSNRPAPIGPVLHLGGLHLKSPNRLPQDIKQFVDNSKHGVVIMSLGSKLKSSNLPARTQRVIVDVFATLPYDIIWKFDSEDMPNKPRNLRLEKWLPQNDLLHHPNVKAFITHGGLQSTDEAIDAGVPLVGLPVHLDQWLNTDQYEKHGIGVRLDIDALEPEEFRNAILAVAERKLFRENVARLRSVMSEQRARGRRAAARWVQHLTSHGARYEYIRSPLADATVLEFYMLDLLLITAICVVLFCVLIGYLGKRVIIICCDIGVSRSNKRM